MRSNYDKTPYVTAAGCEVGHSFEGYGRIAEELLSAVKKIKKEKAVIAIDFYPGVRVLEIKTGLIARLGAALEIYSDEAVFFGDEHVNREIRASMTDDRVFGVMTHYRLDDFIDNASLGNARQKIAEANGLTVVYGVGASLVYEPDIYVYADLARWEIQKRYRSGELANWKDGNYSDDALRKFKRGFFFEWRVADRHKIASFDQFDYILDTNRKDTPKMITAESYQKGLKAAVSSPFRVVPFFDPGVWGGQWMRDKFDLQQDAENYAWAFDCVPEENSLLIKVGETIVETPAINLVMRYPRELLGEKVFARFGAEFPIRLDFLDTVGGQDLSLQVHPSTDYIYRTFGMPYTQDESYYIMDAKDGAAVYLGLRDGVSPRGFIDALKRGEAGESSFPAEEYVNTFPAKKHDHFLIPAGTVHCSGKGTVVLEISATPYIFTFKLWDWDRLGLDGKPRPVHIDHGKNVIRYERNTEWSRDNLVNRVERVAAGDGWVEEKTGLHELQFIETRRHWFSKPVRHHTEGRVNVLNLVEGGECVVESPANAFEPFVVHYAETFIVPASVGPYTVRPCGESAGQTIATLKVYVRGAKL